MDGADSFKLEDRTAILTGPCSGFNQAIASKLTQLGCDVAMIHSNIDRARRFAQQLMDVREVQERFGRAVAIQANIGTPVQAQDAITRAAEAFGGLDIYVDGNLTASPRAFRDPSALTTLDEAIDANLRAPLHMAHGLMRFLEGRKRGRVIFLLHDLARIGAEHHSISASTRMGLMQFAKTLAREISDKNVTVNCVSMGATEDLLMAVASGEAPRTIQQGQAEVAKAFPGVIAMDAERIANAVAFLASPLSAGITGQTIAVNQGLSFIS